MEAIVLSLALLGAQETTISVASAPDRRRRAASDADANALHA
jgi:hypothetical protein